MNPAPLLRRAATHLWRHWVRPLALPVLCITAAKSSLADFNYVPTGSMLPTILPGDVVLVNKLAYDLRVPFTTQRLARWASPQRGDIVVCFEPQEGTRLVKRIAAVAGDTVALRDGVLSINGTAAAYERAAPADAPGLPLEARERGKLVREQLATRTHALFFSGAAGAPRDFGPVRVPAGSYFVLGDARDNSRDSRFFGFMPADKIVGEATTVLISADLEHWLRPRFERFFSRLE